jgi:hypothetical protein
MDWVIALAFLGFVVWRAKRSHEKAAERAASGQLQSPLYWASAGLVLALVGLTFSMEYIALKHSKIPWFLWIIVLLIIVALLLVRRALKWRYPYV